MHVDEYRKRPPWDRDDLHPDERVEPDGDNEGAE